MTDSLQTHYKSYNQFLPFGYTVVFKRQGIFNEMVEEAAKRYPSLNNLKCDPIRSNILSFVYSPEGTNNIFLFTTDEVTLGTLVHECVHVVMRIFESVGAEVNEHTEEFFAYLQDMIFRDTMHILKTKFKFSPVLDPEKK